MIKFLQKVINMSKNHRKAYAIKKNKKKSAILLGSVALVIAIVFLTLTVVAAIKRDRYYDKKNSLEFTPPPFDVSAVSGDPRDLGLSEDVGYSEIYDPTKMSFMVAICGVFNVNENREADVYFANSEKNSVWIKLRVYDENENVVCETGLIRPGEYIKTIKFDRQIENGEALTVKVMSYVPETYMSAGAFKLKPYVISGR